jgi:hypothetical protein
MMYRTKKEHIQRSVAYALGALSTVVACVKAECPGYEYECL